MDCFIIKLSNIFNLLNFAETNIEYFLMYYFIVYQQKERKHFINSNETSYVRKIENKFHLSRKLKPFHLSFIQMMNFMSMIAGQCENIAKNIISVPLTQKSLIDDFKTAIFAITDPFNGKKPIKITVTDDDAHKSKRNDLDSESELASTIATLNMNGQKEFKDKIFLKLKNIFGKLLLR
ncbi:hypothetical protein TRFO_14171 [Tritrichomonas foetus]|uniref:Uncharacterized protein n=1 Tax=Tritrichomonas foetus TaxID=1144522 RepID=A0A1J4KVZ3_9EUKA|nr:hypothetical protein TRFO_14171 [Tritrichomonas foetus]|eukprot:OHT15403.1 hypothetical protein TRFO_14171 [Tritrichomonas foetus]